MVVLLALSLPFLLSLSFSFLFLQCFRLCLYYFVLKFSISFFSYHVLYSLLLFKIVVLAFARLFLLFRVLFLSFSWNSVYSSLLRTIVTTFYASESGANPIGGRGAMVPPKRQYMLLQTIVVRNFSQEKTIE